MERACWRERRGFPGRCWQDSRRPPSRLRVAWCPAETWSLLGTGALPHKQESEMSWFGPDFPQSKKGEEMFTRLEQSPSRRTESTRGKHPDDTRVLGPTELSLSRLSAAGRAVCPVASTLTLGPSCRSPTTPALAFRRLSPRSGAPPRSDPHSQRGHPQGGWTPRESHASRLMPDAT